MKGYFIATGLISILLLTYVDLKIRHQKLLTSKARLMTQIDELDDQLHYIHIEVKEALSDPHLQIALEEIGYQRNFKTTRKMAEYILRSEEKTSRSASAEGIESAW